MDFRPSAALTEEENKPFDFRPSALLKQTNQQSVIDFRPSAAQQLPAETLAPPDSVVSQSPPVMSSPPLVDPYSVTPQVLQNVDQQLAQQDAMQQAQMQAIAAEQEKQKLARQAERNVIKENMIANQAPQPQIDLPTLGETATGGAQDFGTAFQYGDLQTQGNIQNLLADTEAVLADSAPMRFMQKVQNMGLPFINSVREFVGAEPLPENAMQQASIAKELELQNNAQKIFAEAEKLGFKPKSFDEIENFSDFLSWAKTTAGASGAPMIVALASGGSLSPLVLGGELDANLREIEGLSKEDRVKLAYTGGTIAAVIENLGIGLLLKGMPKELIGKLGADKIAQEVSKNYGRRVAGAFIQGMATEGVTETLQEGTFIGTEKFAGKEFEEGEIRKRLTESAAGGATIGGPLRTAAQVSTELKDAVQPKEPQTQTDQPVAPPVDETLPSTTATTQTDVQRKQPDQPVTPSAVSQPNVEQQTPQVEVQQQAPEQSEVQQPEAAPQVQTTTDQTQAQTAPELPNPQEADEIGIDTDQGVRSVQTPDGQKNYNVKGKIVELADLKQATGNLQPRDRSRKESEILSKQRAGTMFNPDRLLDDPTSGSGAPIIARDGTIMSGNGRVLTMQEVYANQPESLAKYEKALTAAGINTTGFSQPVFVRMLTDNMTVADLQEFADLSNTEAQAQMSVTERATRDAKRLTNKNIIDKFRGDFDVNSAQNRDFVKEYAKEILSPTEQGKFFSSDGGVSQEGLVRIKNSILAAAFDDPSTLATMLESSDENIKNISNAFMSSAPKFAQLKKQVANGQIEAHWDKTAKLAEMANIVSRLRREGTNLQDYFNQTDMLSGTTPDPDIRSLVEAFYNPDLTRANSGKAMKDFMDFYASEALQQEKSKTQEQGGFLPNITPEEVIAEGKRRTEAKRNEGKGQQQGLFESNVERDEASSQQVQKRNVAQGRKDTRRRSEEADFDEINSATPNTDDIGTINSGSIFDTQSQTLRQSIYRDAFADSGIDVDAIENKSTDQKFRLLRKVLMDKFGLRDIQAPKEGAGYTQVNQLLDAYHNLQWMMHSLGLPNKAIGLEGSLSLSLPDRATRFLGAYMPGKKEVIMPQRSNSFAHEWAHALDYHILEKYGTGDPTKDIKGITGLVRRTSKSGDRPWLDRTPRNVQEAFGNLINALFLDKAEVSLKIMQLEQDIAKSEARQVKTGKPNKTLEKKREQLRKLQEGSGRTQITPTAFKEQSSEFGDMQQPNRKNYYKRPTEMFARAFEAYIAQSVEASGGNNEFITKGDAAYKMALDQVKGADIRLAMTFPKDHERHNIMLAMDQLMEAMRAESIAKGTAADAPGGSDFIDAEATFWGEVQYQERGSLASAPKRVVQAIINDQKKAFRIARNNAAQMKQRPKKFTGDTFIERKYNEIKDTYGGNFINTKRQILFNIADRYTAKRNVDGEIIKGNPRVKKIMERIISGVATDPGSRQNRVTAEGGTFEEATRINSRRFYATFDRLNKQFNMDTMSESELKSLRLLLTGEAETTADASPKVLKLAGKLRRELLNPIYDYMVKSGQDVNYVQDVGYMPRMLDVPLAMENPSQFKGELGGDKGAIPLYEKVIFDNEYGEYETGNIEQADKLVALARSKGLRSYVDRDFTDMANEIRPTVKTLLDLEKMLKKAEARGEPTADLQRQIDQGKAAIERTHKRLHEYLRRPFAVAAAEDWLHRIQAREGADPSTNGSQGKFSSKRKLPGEADKYMNDFYLNSTDAIMQYIPAAVRSTEYNKRFGRDLVPEGRKLDVNGNPRDFADYLLEEAVSAGMKPHEAQEVRTIVNMVTGRHGGQDNMLAHAINRVNTYGTMSLLPRAVISSIAEPLTVGVQAGSSIKGLKALALAFDGLGASMRGKNAVERKMYYSQLANILGVIDLPQTGEVMANRLGGMQAEDSKSAMQLANFFLRTGLTNVTIAQRRASMRVGIQFIVEQAKQYRETTNAGMKEESRLALQDLGVRPEQMETFAEYASNLTKTRKGFYEIDQIMNADGSLTDMGSVLSVATNRFVDQSIQDPKIVDRPKWAEAPIGRIVFGIQSFIAAFQRNVLEMAVKRGVRGIETRGAYRGGLRLAGQSLLPLFSLYVGHTLVSAAREFIFNRDKWEEEKENEENRIAPFKYLATLGISRSGFTGRLDPFINSLYSLKYQSDFSNVLVGATGSYYLKALQRIFGLGIDNSPNTVSKEYQAVRGTYDIAVPFIAGWLTSLPGVGTTLGYGLGAADMALSSPTVKHYVVREFIKFTHGVEYRPGESSSGSSGSSFIGKRSFD